MTRGRWRICGWIALCLTSFPGSALPQVHDPGPRAGAGPGSAIPGLTAAQMNLFNEGASRFVEVDKVTDGLGPRMNSSSCSGCHAYPAIGGYSPKANPPYA